LWAWKGYKFDVNSSHSVEVPSVTRVELDGYDTGAEFIPDRPRLRWLVEP
jgi:hypothetical protein